VKAGAIFSTPGTGFRNSDNDFFDLDPTYAVQFEPFSKPKTFMPIGAPDDVTSGWRVEHCGAVTGFGIVFSDVDRVGSASIKLFARRAVALAVSRAHPQ